MSNAFFTPESEGTNEVRARTGLSGLYDMASSPERMTAAQEEALHTLMQGADVDTGRSRFLLDIAFTEKRSMHAPFGGIVLAFTNGGFAHGGGDELVYFCPKPVERGTQTKTCAAPIPPNFIKGKVAVCPECRGVSKDVELCGQTYAKLTMQNWAPLVTKFYRRLGGNADLRIAVFNNDLRNNAFAAQQGSDRAANSMLDLRHERHWVRYSLDALIRDTSSGRSLESCIEAFLRA